MRSLTLALRVTLCLGLSIPGARTAADDSDERYVEALSSLRAGNHESAALQFDELLLRDPGNPDWLLGRAQSLIALDRGSEAIPLLELARERAPDYEDVWRVELAALEETNQVSRADRLLEQAARQFPASQWPIVRRADLRERELMRRGTRASLSSSYERLSDDKGEWRALALDFDHPLRDGMHLLAGAHAEERFGERDEQLAGGFVNRFNGGVVVVASGDIAPNATILPQSSLQLEIGWPVGVTSVGLRARHARHETVTVDTLAASVEAGRGEYRFAYSLTATRPSDLDPSLGHSVRISRDYGTGSHMSLVLAHGEEAETVAPGRVLVTRNNSIAVVGVHWHSSAWGVTWDVSYHEQGDLYHRVRIGLGLEHRF